MNRKMVMYLLGQIMKIEAGLLCLPSIVALIYNEASAFAFGITAVIALVCGVLITLLSKPETKVIYAKEGFAIVSLSWLTLSLIGCLPFIISGEIPNFADAFFEIVSGFTTTGASIMANVEIFSNASLFWRSFSHWIGGMGVLVFVMAILPMSERSIHIMRAEVPGPVVGKLVPKIRDTAKILYLIYIVLTIVEFVILLCGGMPVFDSILTSFGTAGTGGFGFKADGFAGYNSFCQWVVTIFMLIFGINFNLYYLILLRKFKSILKSGELWFYLSLIALSTVIISFNTAPLYESVADTIKHSAFQVTSIVTTTGYSTTDFNLWPDLSKALVFILMFVGGCAGSTAGGLKLSRVMILFKSIKRELSQMLHPRAVKEVKIEGKKLDDSTIKGVQTYFSFYMVLIIAVFFLLSFDKFTMETNFTAAVSTFNNVGPALGEAGPMSSYADFSGFSKIVMSFSMLLGRLEIYPMILLFSPTTWAKSK